VFQFAEPALAPAEAPSQTNSRQSPSANLPTKAAIPRFDWPPPRPSARAVIPPRPSARAVIPQHAFVSSKTLGQLASMLEEALEQTGYGELSYYSVPGGIAVVTRMEHIYPDGRPFEQSSRWMLGDSTEFSLSDYLHKLFAVDSGFYRVIVFIVTSEPFGSDDKQVSSAEATMWISRGYNMLPSSLQAQSLTPAHACTALIYQFRRDHGKDPFLVFPSALQAKQHLALSGLWAVLMPVRSK
jgi:hypothetical protein